ncbi:MAG: efflux RND transporter permease subunit, partial [Candidatus Melainabacteria bacterium]|nr:efflux RND transporter permease subunit [Candidatus Melainabacteria bacterium]
LSYSEAAFKSASQRLRPILMTSFAFVVGLLPLAIATGAGAASRQSLGTAVCGGMLISTFISLFLVPVVYILVKGGYARLKGKGSGRPGKAQESVKQDTAGGRITTEENSHE